MRPMLGDEKRRFDGLHNLARERFDPNLNPACEQILRDSCRPGDAEGSSASFTTRPDPHWVSPVVESSFLRWLGTDQEALAFLDPVGIRVYGVVVNGKLDFFKCQNLPSLEFSCCFFRDSVDLNAAQIHTLIVANCTFCGAIDAQYLVASAFILTKVELAETLDLEGAHIAGKLVIDQAVFTGARTAISMRHAVIGTIANLAANLFCEGYLDLHGIRVGGDLWMSDATLRAGLNLDGAEIRGDLFLEGAKVSGEVSMTGAAIEGLINGAGVSSSSATNTLVLDNSNIGQGVISSAADCSGTITMDGTKIGAQLDLAAAVLRSVGVGLSLDNATVTEAVILNGGFTCSGEIRMRLAKLGWLECTHATLSTAGRALFLEGAVIQGGAVFNAEFSCSGEMDLSSSTIWKTLDFSGASVASLKCRGMQADDFIWKRIRNPEQTKLDLTVAALKWLHDDPESWPRRGNLNVDGLVVTEIPDLDEQRIRWVNCQTEAVRPQPQPWMHLAGHLRDKGNTQWAKKAIRTLRMHQANEKRKNAHTFPLRSALLYGWSSAVAFLEQKPLRILWTLGFFWVLGTSVFWPLEKHFGETGDAAYRSTHMPQKGASVQPSGSYPRFLPAVYALENTLPVVRLGQDDRWAPDWRLDSPSGPGVYWFLVAIRWLLILSGWVQAIVLVAALNARFRP